MDLAITRRVVSARQVPFPPEAAPDGRWDVVCFYRHCGTEVVQPLASFGHRFHAEAFLGDLLAGRRPDAVPHGHHTT